MNDRNRVVAVNFAGTDYRLRNRIIWGLFGGSALLVLILVAMIVTGRSHRAQAASMEQKLQELAASEEKIRPVLAEREQVVKDLAAMSGLEAARRFSWTRLLTGLEAVVPVGVALVRVDISLKDGALILDGTAMSPEALRNLMVGLERSGEFSQPLLKHQSLDKGTISFNVNATYRQQAASVENRVPAR